MLENMLNNPWELCSVAGLLERTGEEAVKINVCKVKI